MDTNREEMSAARSTLTDDEPAALATYYIADLPVKREKPDFLDPLCLPATSPNTTSSSGFPLTPTPAPCDGQ